MFKWFKFIILQQLNNHYKFNIIVQFIVELLKQHDIMIVY